VAAALAVAVFSALPRGGAMPSRRPAGSEVDLRRGVLLLAAIAFALAGGAASSLAAYTVSTAVAAGMRVGLAGILVAIASIVGISSRLLVGTWTDRRVGSQLDVVAGMLLVGGLAFWALGVATVPMLWLVVPVAFASGWAWIGSFNLAMIRLNPVAPGAAVGLTQAGGFVGAIVGPAGVGFLAEHRSFATAWTAAAAAALVAAAIVGAIRRYALKEAGAPARAGGAAPG
jgi:hypothetical protein